MIGSQVDWKSFLQTVGNVGIINFPAISVSIGSVEADGSTRNAGQQLQCYACGLPKVHPEFDVVGSYGRKIYNHSCEEMINTIKDGKVDEKFVRTCPVGVKSCFGATGFYDHEDKDPDNDIWIRFLGCSEAKYMHEYGCDRDMQKVSVKDKNDRRIQASVKNSIQSFFFAYQIHFLNLQVDIEVNLCFCSQHLCNHPQGELMTSKAASTFQKEAALAAPVILSWLLLTASFRCY